MTDYDQTIDLIAPEKSVVALHRELLQIKNKLKQREAELTAVLEASKEILKNRDFDTAARMIFKYCKELIGATSGYVALINDKGFENKVIFLDTGPFVCTVGKNLQTPIRGLRQEVFELKKARFENDFLKCDYSNLIPPGHIDLQNVLFAPLIIDGKAVGLLGLGNKPSGFTENDAELATTFGEFAAISLLNVSTFQSLETAKAAAEEASKAKSNFLANVSHELRTPLAAIIGFTDLIMEKSSTSPNQDNETYVGIIQRNGRHLLALLDDLLDLSKIEAGQFEIFESKVFLVDEISEAIEIIHPLVEKKNIFCKVQYLGPMPEQILCDAKRVRQILINILSNAVKFTDNGGITISVRLDRSFDNSYPPRIEILVRDTGIGIDPKTCEVLFQPFSRGKSLSPQKEKSGYGLGLSLSKNIAKRLGGDLTLVKTVQGKGSIFKILLPAKGIDQTLLLKVDDKTIFNQELNNRKKIVAGKLDGLKILVAEDNEDIQAFLRGTLKRANASVHLCWNGAEAIEAIKQTDFDVVLMDLEMPEVGGQEATRILRKENFTKPIIAVTAHAFKESIENCIKCGFDDFLTKPVNINLLVETIDKHVTDWKERFG